MKRILKIGFMVMAALVLATAPGWAASYHPVLEQERAFIGATHVATITSTDLTETNVNTAQTISNLFNVAAKQRVELIGMELVTAFNAGNNATGSVLVTVGDGAAGTDFYLDSTELDSNKTEVWSKFGRAYQGITTATSLNGTNVATTTKSATTNVTTTTKAFGTNVATTTKSATTNVATSAVAFGTNVATTTKSATTNVATSAVAFGTNVATTTKSATTNVAYTTVVITQVVNGVTNAITVLATITPQNSDVLATASLETANGLTGVTAQNSDVLATAALETANGLTGVTAQNSDVLATATIQTESQTRVTALTDSASGRKVYTAADTIDFVFTPNSVNSLSQNTTGEVRFYFKVVR